MAISKSLLVWLTVVVLIHSSNSAAAAKAAAGRSSKSSRRSSSSSNWDDSFDRTFPEKLRGEGFGACGSKNLKNAGERGVCKLLAALDEQLKLLGESDHQSSSSSSSLNSSSSCRFRDENGASLHRYASQRSPHLQSLLERYTKMHRACVSLEHAELKKKIYEDEKQLNPQCRYIVWSCTFGLGNKLMSLVSTFLYAMLSQRVLLLDEGSSWDKLFCEPFQGSHWRLPPGLSLKDDESPSFSDFHRLNCGSSSRTTSSACSSSKVVPVVFSATTKPSEHRFLVCPSAMASVRNVPILNFRNSNQHFAVGFFLNPALRPVLEELFPERRVFHDLAHFLLSPGNEVWAAIKRLLHEEPRFFSGAFRRVGVQLRESKDEYRDYYDMAVPRCIRSKAGLCPIEIDEFLEAKSKQGAQESIQNSSSSSNEDYIAVYISSLAGGHATNLSESLRKMEAETGQRFELVTQGSDGEQIDDVDHQQKALVDLWALSMADVLLTSHMSTFGYTAQGLAGVTPYLLKPWPDNPCWSSLSSDPCFHFAPGKLACKEDNFVNVAPPGGKNNYVRPCPDLPDTGLQLVEP